MTPLRFLKTAVHDFRVGAITKSSPFVVAEVLRALPPQCATIVEYGAGDGIVTRAMLRTLPATGRLVAIERNAELLSELRTITDPRLTIMDGDAIACAQDLRSFMGRAPDAVTSGIPCTFLTSGERETLVEATHTGLDPSGRFIVYQYSPLMLPLLQRRFRTVRVRYEPLNFLPYFIMTAEK